MMAHSGKWTRLAEAKAPAGASGQGGHGAPGSFDRGPALPPEESDPPAGKSGARRPGIWAVVLLGLLLLLGAVLWLGRGSLFPGKPEEQARSLPEQLSFLVQGNLDALYLGVFDGDYCALTGQSEAQCEAAYQAGIEEEAAFFAAYAGVEHLSDEQRDRLTDSLKKLYAQARYLVTDCTAVEGGYTVGLKITPLGAMYRLAELLEQGTMDWFFEAYAGGPGDMSEESYRLYEAEWMDDLLSLLEADQVREDPGYLEPVYLDVRLEKDGDGLWAVDSASMDDIDYWILPYPQ